MKRTMLATTLAGFGLAALWAPAVLAQKAPAPAAQAAPAAAPAAGAPAGGNSVSYKQRTVYDFDDDTVEGDLVRPDGELVDTRRGAKHSSLIKIRENFIPEMLKSVEAI
jgi:hypothetical protein